MRGNIKVVLEGRGRLTLGEMNYVRTGGEAAVYRAERTIIKCYTDPRKMGRDGMADKVKLLAATLQHHAIAAPQGVVSDEAGRPIGFYMPLVEGEPAPRAFVRDFRERHQFGDSEARMLAAEMLAVFSYAHERGVLLVDPNETNWIIGLGPANRVFTPQAIDVDSWAVDRWVPASPADAVVMPSIRDWNAAAIGEASDWFAWAIVTFQLLVGIHPYRGTLDGWGKADLVPRMKANASVFAPGCRLPAAARDPAGCIYPPLLEWYRATFQDGHRAASPPPSPNDVAPTPAKVARVLRASTGPGIGLLHEKLFGILGDPVVRVWPSGVLLLRSGKLVHVDGRGLGLMIASPDGAEVVEAAPDSWIVADVDRRDGKVSFFMSGDEVLPLRQGLALQRVWRAGERLFGITDREAVELAALPPLQMAPGRRWGVRPNATRWFDGVAVQDILGAAMLFLPTATGVAQVRVKALDGLLPVAGCGARRFAAIVAVGPDGAYRRVEVTLGDDHAPPTVWVGPNDGPDLNMVALPTGVVATVVEDGELVIFVPVNGRISRVRDRDIATDVRLARIGDRVVYVRDGDLWRVSVR